MLCLHRGGKHVSYEELRNVQMPEKTRSYCPISHQSLVDLVEKRVRNELDYDGKMLWDHGLNKRGNQYFGQLALVDYKLTEQQCLQIALRNSLNKSLGVAFGAGSRVFVCDNLMLSADLVQWLRKHTTNAWRDINNLLTETLYSLPEKAKAHAEQIESWNQKQIMNYQGYEMIGVLRGMQTITADMSNIMYREWDKLTHPENKNLWSLYNAATEAVKVAHPAKAFQTHVKLHKFFQTEAVADAVIV